MLRANCKLDEMKQAQQEIMKRLCFISSGEEPLQQPHIITRRLFEVSRVIVSNS